MVLYVVLILLALVFQGEETPREVLMVEFADFVVLIGALGFEGFEVGEYVRIEFGEWQSVKMGGLTDFRFRLSFQCGKHSS